ncbi:MAG TPA: Uma2 family endonuclease, partial [Gemmatimonadaceae bacterium]
AWERTPRPILIVEVFSGSTRRRDQLQKRQLYTGAGIAEYWMIDPESRTITVVRPEQSDETVRDTLAWHPAGANAPLVIQLAEVLEPGS